MQGNKNPHSLIECVSLSVMTDMCAARNTHRSPSSSGFTANFTSARILDACSGLLGRGGGLRGVIDLGSADWWRRVVVKDSRTCIEEIT